jgi:hypothetical protein
MTEKKRDIVEPSYLADILQTVVIHKDKLPKASAQTMIELVEALCTAEAALRRYDAEARILEDVEYIDLNVARFTS